ncbi:serine/threonine-protein kinase Ssk22p [Trichomonascus vanleenenianus]|uniref:mitogen-activated protein kinase kinase kinase SSK2 n=1 Tax=Trichomonascus vanleenenianus TaxID=2268995 RepID=UPI003ECA9BEC
MHHANTTESPSKMRGVTTTKLRSPGADGPPGPVVKPTIKTKAHQPSNINEMMKYKDTQAQYLAQEKAYLEKIKNDLQDDYVRELKPIAEVSQDDESSSNSSAEDDEDRLGKPFLGEPRVENGAVGASYDDEYTDMGLFYPFLETGLSHEDLDNAGEGLQERLEWQAMLSSVLNGEVVRSEKRRIRGPKNGSMMLDDDLWLGIRAKVCGRTVAEQKRVVDYNRTKVGEVIDEFWNFKIQYQNESTLESTSEQVQYILGRVEKIENLWKSMQAMREECKAYGDAAFQRRLDALVSWSTITNSITRELDLLRVWTGNQDLDPTRPPDNKGDDPMEERSTLVENVLKQDDITNIFELRLNQTVGPLIVKAREATVEYSEIYVELGLPLFHERLSHVMSFPVKLIQEIIRLRLVYARRLVNPTMMIVDQMISDLRLYIQIGTNILRSNLEYTSPIFDKGWVFPNHADENFNKIVLDCLGFYLGLLHSKFIHYNSKPLKDNKFQTFKETEQLEQQYSFLKGIASMVDGGDIVLAEQFSSLQCKMLQKLHAYWESQMKGPAHWTAHDIERWFTITVESVRSFQRKLLRFYRMLSSTYENASEYAIQVTRLKSFALALKNSGHFLVYTGGFEKYGIYIIADQSLASEPERIKSILNGYSRCEPLTDDERISYVLILCIQEPLVWEGDIVNIDMPYGDLELAPGRMRLVSEGRSSELYRARVELSEAIGIAEMFEILVDTKSHLVKVNHELARVRKQFYKIAVSVINAAIDFRSRCKPIGCQESVQNMFIFAREFGQRGLQVMDPGRRGTLCYKMINLCVEWVTFIVDDCVPTDYKTFRWTVVALEFAMVMTRGVNIMVFSKDQFAKLRVKVAGCMTLLISHFDIMGARSKAAERQQSLEVARRNKLLNIQYKDDDELMTIFRSESLKKLNQTEEARMKNMVVGKILDDTNTDSEFLTFLASSFSNVSIRWQQGRFIGGGSFGTVYAAVNLDTGGVMAVKEIRLQDTQSIRHILKSIKDEMTVLEILNHPNIVQYYGVEVHRDKVFIFMEYCQGGSLGGLLDYGRIEDETVIQIYTLQMLEGLAYLHQSGIVHRDIKPENILLDHMGVIKFVDFGAAKVIAKTGKTRGGAVNNGKTKLNSMTGTPMYMSPEVITGSDPGRHGSIDIWSTGCCVLEMATGRRPWANLDNEWAIMYHIAAGHLPQLPSKDQLSEAGQAFLMKCFERDPKKRMTATELLKHDPWIKSIRDQVVGLAGENFDEASGEWLPDMAAAHHISSMHQQHSTASTNTSTANSAAVEAMASVQSASSQFSFHNATGAAVVVSSTGAQSINQAMQNSPALSQSPHGSLRQMPFSASSASISSQNTTGFSLGDYPRTPGGTLIDSLSNQPAVGHLQPGDYDSEEASPGTRHKEIAMQNQPLPPDYLTQQPLQQPYIENLAQQQKQQQQQDHSPDLRNLPVAIPQEYDVQEPLERSPENLQNHIDEVVEQDVKDSRESSLTYNNHSGASTPSHEK